MASSFKDDSYRRPNFSYRRPNFATDGALPEKVEVKWILPSRPSLPEPKPDLPWGIDPRTLPEQWKLPIPSPQPPPQPAPPPHDVDPPSYPNSLITENLSGREEAVPRNWLTSYESQIEDDRRGSITYAPEGVASATSIAPAASVGGLPGMLYELMRQSKLEPERSFNSNPQDSSEQAPPERRRLMRRTYRQ
ncbi:MAG: hypothetical protein Q8L13_18180 [Bradyrhizobium sp.]|uniref:hypothetical protein n=1 Tax=Bradyrhizobium sp. TaxID=376 RepID=UPI002731065C|nr:hypothetical protein [Bradyrhizobium sp.]MDP1868250.1 hypothetical protein [Bradyrhizobium sp.]